ncbi:hypothetical protein BB561_000039, partial [Smittium simulii]
MKNKNILNSGFNYSEYRKNLIPLTPVQKEILIGLMLGDLNLQKTSKNYRIRFEQGLKHKDYIYHLYSIFKEYIINEPYKIVRKNKITNNLTTTFRLQSISHWEFKFLAELFLNPKKIVPKNLIRDHLTPRGFTYWFMDDGGKLDYSKNQGKGIVLNTQSFTEEEVLQMTIELNNKFNFKTWVGKNKSKYVIKISGSNFDQILKMMDPYILSSMRYKLPTPRK